MGKKLERISIRIDEDLNNQFDEVASSLKVSRPELLRLLMQSVCDAYEEYGQISIPIKIQKPQISIIDRVEEAQGIYKLKETDPEIFLPEDISMEDFAISLNEITNLAHKLAINKTRYKRAKQNQEKENEI